MSNIASYFSIFRIIFSPLMLLVNPFSIEFIIIYLICGISDILDGYIARKTSTISKLGDNLDSIGDFIMILIVLFILLKSIGIPRFIVIWTIIIGIIKIISVIVVFKKYKTFEMLHTYMNKITGFLLFIFPITLTFISSDISMIIICLIASLAAIEELMINLLVDELDINRKSIFLK